MRVLLLGLSFFLMAGRGEEPMEMSTSGDIHDSGVIIGIVITGDSDDRQPVDRHSYYTQRTGHMSAYFKSFDITRNCTATLVAPDKVLTASHCLLEDGEVAESARFQPGVRTEGDIKGPGFKAHSAFINRKFMENTREVVTHRDLDYDLAIVKFESNDELQLPGNQYGWIGFGYRSGMDDMSVSTAGYPLDKDKYSLWQDDSCNAKVIREHLMEISCDIIRGQSGSPVISTNSDGDDVIYGVVSGENDDPVINYATRIDINHFQKLLAVKDSEDIEHYKQIIF